VADCLTDLGKAIRAVAREREGAAQESNEHIYAMTFAIGTAVARPPRVSFSRFSCHTTGRLRVCAGRVYDRGAAAGSRQVRCRRTAVWGRGGFVRSISGKARQIGIFVIFILVLLFRPNGLFERAHERRVAGVIVLALFMRSFAVRSEFWLSFWLVLMFRFRSIVECT
jgi:hypothetical protein